MPGAEKVAGFDDLLKAVETLDRHVQALQRDTARLAGRIKQAPHEAGPAQDYPGPLPDPKPKNPRELVKYIFEIDKRLRNAEGNIGFCKGQIDQISNDSYSRAEFKKLLDGQDS
jgi:hypothetical protein